MIIHFPALHPEFLSGPAPQSALFFDPGLEDAPRDNGYRPDGLSLDPAKARRLLQDSLQFGRQFKNPGDMVSQAMFQEAEDNEHSWTIRAEFEQRLKMDAAKGRKEAEDDAALGIRAQAQFLLLLASSTQQQALELRALSRDVSQAWEEFDAGLGLDEEEKGDEAMASISRTLADTNPLDDSVPPIPWPWLLGAMAAWLPEGTVLAASEADVVSAWNDLDLGFAPADAALGLPAGWLMATAPAWKLAGKRRAPSGTHWNKELTAALPAT